MRPAEETGDTTGTMSSAFWCCFYGAGIVGSLVVYGLFQERIMTIPYGQVLFTISPFLVFCNRIFNMIFAIVMTKSKNESFMWKAPLWKYMIVSLSNVAATSCQYEALKYVSFPVQMLGKSFKMMPVMVWGILISRKRYGLIDWCVAACVTGGVTEFLLTGPISSTVSHGNSIKGLMLLLLFLVCDGLTSTMQEKLFKEHATSKYNQMLYVNGCSAIVSFLTLVIIGHLGTAFAFCGAHGLFVVHALLLSGSAVASQFFIYSQVKEFGALVFAATMNVRQVASILISYARYHHQITWLQIVGLAFVFGALFFKSVKSISEAPSKEESRTLVNDGKPGEKDENCDGAAENRAAV